MNLRRPIDPSSWKRRLSLGETVVINCMIIDAVMYGPTPSTTIDNCESPPPEKRFKKLKNWLFSKNWAKTPGLTPGTGIDAKNRKAINITKVKRILFRRYRSLIRILNFRRNEFIRPIMPPYLQPY